MGPVSRHAFSEQLKANGMASLAQQLNAQAPAGGGARVNPNFAPGQTGAKSTNDVVEQAFNALNNGGDKVPDDVMAEFMANTPMTLEDRARLSERLEKSYNEANELGERHPIYQPRVNAALDAGSRLDAVRYRLNRESMTALMDPNPETSNAALQTVLNYDHGTLLDLRHRLAIQTAHAAENIPHEQPSVVNGVRRSVQTYVNPQNVSRAKEVLSAIDNKLMNSAYNLRNPYRTPIESTSLRFERNDPEKWLRSMFPSYNDGLTTSRVEHGYHKLLVALHNMPIEDLKVLNDYVSNMSLRKASPNIRANNEMINNIIR